MGDFVDEGFEVVLSKLHWESVAFSGAYDSRPVTSQIRRPSFLFESSACRIELVGGIVAVL